MLSYRFLPHCRSFSDTPFQLHVLSRDKYCTLIVLCPHHSVAQYFDSSNTTYRKDYDRIKGVLNEAIEGYAQNGGTFHKAGEYIRPANGKHGFRHVTEFPCVKQPESSTKEPFYAIYHLKGIVRDAVSLNFPSRLRDWADTTATVNQDDLREHFHRIKVKISEIIIEDVNKKGGSLYQPIGLCQRDIQERLERQGDYRTWTTKELYKPFPAPLPPVPPKKKKSR